MPLLSSYPVNRLGQGCWDRHRMPPTLFLMLPICGPASILQYDGDHYFFIQALLCYPCWVLYSPMLGLWTPKLMTPMKIMQLRAAQAAAYRVSNGMINEKTNRFLDKGCADRWRKPRSCMACFASGCLGVHYNGCADPSFLLMILGILPLCYAFFVLQLFTIPEEVRLWAAKYKPPSDLRNKNFIDPTKAYAKTGGPNIVEMVEWRINNLLMSDSLTFGIMDNPFSRGQKTRPWMLSEKLCLWFYACGIVALSLMSLLGCFCQTYRLVKGPVLRAVDQATGETLSPEETQAMVGAPTKATKKGKGKSGPKGQQRLSKEEMDVLVLQEQQMREQGQLLDDTDMVGLDGPVGPPVKGSTNKGKGKSPGTVGKGASSSPGTKATGKAQQSPQKGGKVGAPSGTAGPPTTTSDQSGAPTSLPNDAVSQFKFNDNNSAISSSINNSAIMDQEAIAIGNNNANGGAMITSTAPGTNITSTAPGITSTAPISSAPMSSAPPTSAPPTSSMPGGATG